MKILQILSMYHSDGEKILKENAEVIKIDHCEPEYLISKLSDVDGIVLRAPARITREVLDVVDSVKVISGAGTGLDNIDVEYATKKGIPVFHAPKVNTNATAEHAVGLIFSLMKKIPVFHTETMAGNFRIRDSTLPSELKNKKLALIGWGDIAKRVGEICSLGLGMNVISYVRSFSKEKKDVALSSGVTLSDDLNSIFAECDIISVHLPLTKETKGLINRKYFSLMKPEAYIINTGRGAVINEEDLFRCLKEKQIAGAGLDVFANEPLDRDHPFVGLDNVILTPHIGGIAKEPAQKASVIVAQNVINFLNGYGIPGIGVANPEVVNTRPGNSHEK